MCVNFVYILIYVHVFICVILFFLIMLGVELITHDMKIKEKKWLQYIHNFFYHAHIQNFHIVKVVEH
jgi:hypothetical protein